jgi:hypothetical protein
MIQVIAAAIFLFCFPISSFAQMQPAPEATTQRAALAAKPTAKKLAPASNVAAKSTKPAESRSCQIGVIPIAGNLFLVENFGLVTFADTYARVAVDGWALDELVVSRVRAAAPGMSVRRIPFTREELRNAPRQKSISLFRSSATDIKEFAQYLAPRINCERYVVIHRHGGGNHREFGIGISRHRFGRPVYLFAMMYIRVYDGRTFELIREAEALTTEDTFMNRVRHHPLGGPSRELDPSMFPEKPTDAVASPVLRDGVRAMLTASLDKTLPGMLRRPAQEATR